MVEQEVLDTDPEQFDCETCVLAIEIERLDVDNAEAWRLYHQMQSRFAVDFGLTQPLFEGLVLGWSSAEVREVFERLAIIHDVLSPRPVERT